MWEILLSLQILVQRHSLTRVEIRLSLKTFQQDTYIISPAETPMIPRHPGSKDLKTANKE